MFKTILIIFFSTFGKIAPKLTAEIAWPLFCAPIIKQKPLTNNEQELAEQAKKFSIKVNNYKISVLHWSAQSNLSATSHATILLTHGWTGHALNFSSIIEVLRLQGYNVVAYDSPAHGVSTGKRTTLLANTQALIEVAKKVGPIDILIGHSFGCLASVFALDLDKEGSALSEVKKLILIAGPNKLTDLFSSFTAAMHLPVAVLKIFFHKVEQLVHRPIESISVEGLLKTVKAEVLIIHDKKDPVVPFQEAESITNKTHAELFVTKGFGHSRILSAESVLDKINEFLQLG